MLAWPQPRSRAGGGEGAWVAPGLSRMGCGECQGARRSGSHLRSGPAWAGGQPNGLSNLSAPVGWGRGVLPFELRPCV